VFSHYYHSVDVFLQLVQRPENLRAWGNVLNDGNARRLLLLCGRRGELGWLLHWLLRLLVWDVGWSGESDAEAAHQIVDC
jgi:hypothetical protein